MTNRYNASRLQVLGWVAVLVTVSSGVVACSPGAPPVDRATLWIDTVKQGDFVKMRRGPGSLVESEDGEIVVLLRIPEAQSFDLAVGQRATVDLRIGTGEGRVAAIADRIEAGTVAVTVELLGELPQGARLGLSVDGRVEIETIEDVLYVGKPAFGQAGAQVGLFKLVEDGEAAVRVPVVLGESSVNLIEVVSGLEEGDEIILSDMSRFDSVDRVRLR